MIKAFSVILRSTVENYTHVFAVARVNISSKSSNIIRSTGCIWTRTSRYPPSCHPVKCRLFRIIPVYKHIITYVSFSYLYFPQVYIMKVIPWKINRYLCIGYRSILYSHPNTKQCLTLGLLCWHAFFSF